MLKKLQNWYGIQTSKSKLLIAFLFNCCLWIFIEVISDLIFPPDHPASPAGTVFKVLFTATFWTLIFDWKKVKSAFRKS